MKNRIKFFKIFSDTLKIKILILKKDLRKISGPFLYS